MSIIVVALVSLLVVGSAVFLVGWPLPPVREGRAETMIAAPPERVLAVIKDVESQIRWRDGIARVIRTPGGWQEVTARGETITFLAEEMGVERIRLRLTSDRGYTGSSEAQLVPHGNGTLVNVTERSEFRSPVKRLIARLMFDPKVFATTILRR